ncbi:MAG TPA: DUF4097 family beta strand repeat-containing protein [Bryobacteraceae bacterium]|jgi:DUF4097 and DUF4098 domain-containing protein YvlB|nr:DUF4097 family beta strand repeat-containing protein [Bryobacteraceae bacterium]
MRPRTSITAPLILIAIGVLFLLHALSPDFPIGDVLASYWPFLLIAWGVLALLEVCILALRGAPLPVNGISGGGWFLVILICIAGLITFEVHRPDTWWRRTGWEHGVQAFGEEHDYSIDTIQKTVGKSPHIVIERFRGDAKITASDSTDLTLTGHKTIRSFDSDAAERANSASRVEVIVQGDTVTIRCNQDRAGVHAPVTTDLEISVPKGAHVEATGTLGDFDISGLAGNVELNSENAGVRLEDIGGDVKVDTRRSDLVRCANVSGSVDLRGKGDDVELTKIAGQVNIEGEYSGTVSLRDLAKPLHVQNMRTQLDVQQVSGEIRLDRGSLDAENVAGPVKLVTRATDVTFTGFTDALDVTIDKGDVDLKPGHVPLANMNLHTGSGNIELSLPAAAAFALNASTGHGEIDNEFGDALKERTEGHGARLEGSIGSGPELKLATDRGSITVRKTAVETSPGTTSITSAAGVQEARAVFPMR